MKHVNLTEEIKRSFANKYLKWGLLIDDSVIDSAGVNLIQKESWEIRFIEATDEKGDYLEFYAISSDYSDEHFRIYNDGQIETCATIAEGYSYNESLPGNKAVQRQAYVEKNREIYQYLKTVGLYRR